MALSVIPIANAAVEFDAQLIRKLSQQGPRYTSYPTADRFNGAFGHRGFVDVVAGLRQRTPVRPLSLYLHIPFCDTVCYYCACNKIVIRDRSKAVTYLAYLKREISMQGQLFAGMNGIEQLHLGGGTPTYFSDAQMDELMAHLRRPVPLRQHRPDLRIAETERGDHGADLGQGDHRQPGPGGDLQLRPPAAPVQAAAPHRRGGHAQQRDPARHAGPVYPPPDRGRLRLHRHGPFRPSHRRPRGGPARRPAAPEFPGYSTHAETDMVACGVSAISAVAASYSQNVKTLDAYYERLDRDELPIERGIALDYDDVLRRAVIQMLMCDFELQVAPLEQAHGIDFQGYFATELGKLALLAADGLLTIEPGRLKVTPKGRLLIRNICMVFDRYLNPMAEPLRYSRTI